MLQNLAFRNFHRQGPRKSLVILAALSLLVLWGQSDSVNFTKVPTGAVVAQITGRLVGGGGLDGEYELIAYFTFLEGAGSALFAGDATESNAILAMRSERFRFQTFPNGPLIHFGRLAVPVTQPAYVRLYHMASPRRDLSRPFTFSEGNLVGTLRTRGIQGSLTPSMMFRAEGSIAAESATDFNIGDQKVNLKALGESFVVSLSGIAPSEAEFNGSAISVPFSGVIRATEKFADQVVITPGSGGFGPPGK